MGLVFVFFLIARREINRRKGGKVRLRSGRESSATEKKAPCNRAAVILPLSIRRESLRGINQRLL